MTAGGSFSLTGESPIRVVEGFGAHAFAGFVAPVRSWAAEEAAPARLVDELVLHLLARMLLVCLPVFHAGAFEVFALRRPPFDGWAATLVDAPALARALGVVAANGRTFSRELLARLTADRAELDPLLTTGAAPAQTSSRWATGDSHDGGRVVLPVALEDGRRLLYKPKDLRGAGVLARLLEALGASLRLPARMERDGYLWEAFVVERLPASPDGWGDLSHEVGMWTCLFDLLGTADMIGPNAVVSGSRLVPVDVETLLTFAFVPADDLPWLPAGTSSRLISAPMPARNQTLLGDVGLLADPARLPLLDHLDEALAGYAEMHARLAGARTPVHAILDELADAPLRAVVRDTWVYTQLLLQSLAPEALRSGAVRELVLERLWRVRRRHGLPVALVEAEVESLRDLDVPLFRFLPGGRNLLCPGGRVAPAALSEAPLDRVRARLDALRAEPDPAELDAVAAQFFCGAENAPRRAPAVTATWDAEPVDAAVDWGAEAVRAGDELLELLARGAPGGTRLEAGILYYGGSHLFGVSPRRPADLLSGSLGIAVALADLAAVSGRERFAAEAARQRRPAVAVLQALVDDVARWSRSRTDPPPGALHWGLPAALYALLRLPAAGDEDALARAGSTLAGFAAGDAYRLGRWLRGTMPSALLAATSVGPRAVAAVRGASELAAATEGLRERLAALLAETWERLLPEPAPRPALASLLPSRHALAALALVRHARALGTPLPKPAVAWAASFPQTGVGEGTADRLIALELGAGIALREAATPATSLGCLDVIEEELLRRQVARGPASLELAHAAGAQLLANRRMSGRWFPEGVAPDRFRLSALWGLAAVVRAFTGLAAPERWSSLRLLQQPPYAPGSQPRS